MVSPVHLTPATVRVFRQKIYRYYRQHGRTLSWRKTRNPYHILVSEVMLQQTQVERVAEKYEEFISAFPDFKTLASAPLRKILQVWQGMGYNRRALYLQKIAQAVSDNYNGKLPRQLDELIKLPGIGKNTASAIAAFAFNKPVAFIETNIRSVFIHFFFCDRDSVRDNEIMPLVEKTIDTENPRKWYYALMDYGVMLKKTHPNPSRKSAHHQKQGRFEGSNRQVRGRIIKVLTENPNISEAAIIKRLGISPEGVKSNLDQLQKEELIRKKGNKFNV